MKTLNVKAKSDFLMRGEHVSSGEIITVNEEQASDLWGWRIYRRRYRKHHPLRDFSQPPVDPVRVEPQPTPSYWHTPKRTSRPKPRPPFRPTYRKPAASKPAARKMIPSRPLWQHIAPLSLADEEKARHSYNPPPFVIRHRPKVIYGDDYEPTFVR